MRQRNSAIIGPVQYQYKRAIYIELGPELAQKIIDSDCGFELNVDTLEYTFSNCPQYLLTQVLEKKRSKGSGSILHEFYVVPK